MGPLLGARGWSFPARQSPRVARPLIDKQGGGQLARFLHLTDLHVDAQLDAEKSGAAALDRVMEIASNLRPKADFAIVSGDLVDRGDVESYRVLADHLAQLDMPVLLALGNHDARAPFCRVFPEVPTISDLSVCYQQRVAGVRVIVLDSLVEGQTSGALTAPQLAFLDEVLREETQDPTLLVMHHPPIRRPEEEAAWANLSADSASGLADVLSNHRVDAILCGHIHQTRLRYWTGRSVVSVVGLHSRLDPLGATTVEGGLDIVQGTGLGICDIDEAGFDLTVVPLWSAPQVASVPASVLSGLT